jgi:hypothetical protein
MWAYYLENVGTSASQRPIALVAFLKGLCYMELVKSQAKEFSFRSFPEPHFLQETASHLCVGTCTLRCETADHSPELVTLFVRYVAPIITESLTIRWFVGLSGGLCLFPCRVMCDSIPPSTFPLTVSFFNSWDLLTVDPDGGREACVLCVVPVSCRN